MKTYADSRAATHCFHDVHASLKNSIEPCEARLVLFPDNTSAQAQQCGEVLLKFENSNICLKQVLLIPSLGYSLVSTGQLADNRIESCFRRHDVVLEQESNKTIIGYGTREPDCKICGLSDSLHATSSALLSNMDNSEKELGIIVYRIQIFRT